MKINKFTYLTYLVFLFSLTALGQPIKNDHSLDTLNFKRCCHNCNEIDYCVLDSVFKNRDLHFSYSQEQDEDNYIKTRKFSWVLRKGWKKKFSLYDYVNTHYYHRVMNQKIQELHTKKASLDTLIVWNGISDEYCFLDSTKHHCLIDYQLNYLHSNKMSYKSQMNAYHKKMFEKKFQEVKVLIFNNPVGCCSDTIYDTTNLFLYHFPFNKFTALETIVLTGNDADIIIDLPYTNYPSSLKSIKGYSLHNKILFEKNVNKHLPNLKLFFGYLNDFSENEMYYYPDGENLNYFIYKFKLHK